MLEKFKLTHNISPVILYLHAWLLALEFTLKYAVICHGGVVLAGGFRGRRKVS